jgi:hypothetical protein
VSRLERARHKGQRGQRDEGNLNPPEGNPNFSEGNPSPYGKESKKKRKEIQIKCLTFLRRIEPFQSLTPTPTAFSPFETDSGFKRRGKVGVARSPPSCPSVLRSSFPVPPAWKQVSEGLAPFSDRGRLDAISVRPVGRGASSRKGEPRCPRSKSPGTRGKRQADRSDVRQEYARLAQLEPVSSLWIADGRQPFMP